MQKSQKQTKMSFKVNGQEFSVIYDQNDIQNAIESLSTKINNFYKSVLQSDKKQSLIAVCLLKKGLMFYTDLMKKLNFLIEPQFIRRSQDDNLIDQNGFQAMIFNRFKNRHILLIVSEIERTQNFDNLIKRIRNCQPKSFQIVSLLTPLNQHTQNRPKWSCFQCPNQLVGYGFAFKQFYRNLPELYRKN